MSPFVLLPGIDCPFELLPIPAASRRESPVSPAGVDSADSPHPKQPREGAEQ